MLFGLWHVPDLFSDREEDLTEMNGMKMSSHPVLILTILCILFPLHMEHFQPRRVYIHILRPDWH